MYDFVATFVFDDQGYLVCLGCHSSSLWVPTRHEDRWIIWNSLGAMDLAYQFLGLNLDQRKHTKSGVGNCWWQPEIRETDSPVEVKVGWNPIFTGFLGKCQVGCLGFTNHQQYGGAQRVGGKVFWKAATTSPRWVLGRGKGPQHVCRCPCLADIYHLYYL